MFKGTYPRSFLEDLKRTSENFFQGSYSLKGDLVRTFVSLRDLPFMLPGCLFDGYTIRLYTPVITVTDVMGNIFNEVIRYVSIH